MNKDEILEKILGNRMILLAKETRRAAGSKQEIHLRIADSLREIFSLLGRSSKSRQDSPR
jgi:hypothetical protein